MVVDLVFVVVINNKNNNFGKSTNMLIDIKCIHIYTQKKEKNIFTTINIKHCQHVAKKSKSSLQTRITTTSIQICICLYNERDTKTNKITFFLLF